MCGRYTLTETEHLKGRYNLATVPDGLHPNYNVAPTQTMPVIVHGDKGNELKLMRWGIPRFVGQGKVTTVFNTRSDKVFGSWKKLVLNQRLLVPANGFYEWKHMGDAKQPYYIRPAGADVFSFAGVWNRWRAEDGQEIDVYSIMTTEPNDQMQAIHNRMPVILSKQDEQHWLDESMATHPEALSEFLHPYMNQGLELYPVSTDVNSSRVNDVHLLAPLK